MYSEVTEHKRLGGAMRTDLACPGGMGLVTEPCSHSALAEVVWLPSGAEGWCFLLRIPLCSGNSCIAASGPSLPPLGLQRQARVLSFLNLYGQCLPQDGHPPGHCLGWRAPFCPGWVGRAAAEASAAVEGTVNWAEAEASLLELLTPDPRGPAPLSPPRMSARPLGDLHPHPHPGE